MPSPPEHLRFSYDAARFVRHLGLRRFGQPLVERAEARIARWLRDAPEGRIQPVDRRSNLSAEAFQRDYVATGTPVVLPGFAAHWPAVKKWSPRYLADRYGDDTFLVADRDAGESQVNKPGGKAMKLSLREAVDRLYAGRRVNAGFDSIIHRHPELFDDFLYEEFEALLPRGAKPGIRDTFMGARGTATAIHSALNNNLFTCVHGIKRWYFFHPRLDWAFRPLDANAPYFSSNCDPESPDHSEYPLFRWADGLHVDLEPGDVVYLPPLWWHFVMNVEHAIGVGFRWINLKQALRTAPIKTLMVLTATKPSVIAVERAKRNNDFSLPFRLREELLD